MHINYICRSNFWARSSGVEHLPFKQRVGGSSPPALTIDKATLVALFILNNFKELMINNNTYYQKQQV